MCNIIFLNQAVTGDCSNTSSGAFTISVSGDSPGFSLNWVSPSGGTSPISIPYNPITSAYTYSITNLSGGTYSFYIQDSCIPNPGIYPKNIFISTGTCVSIDNVQNTTCSLDNGSLTASTSTLYSPPAKYYLYETTLGYIQSANTFSNYAIFTPLSAGTYYVIADDGGGCTGMSETCIIKSSTTFTCDIFVVDNAGCYGTNSGAIYVTNLNGVPPYTYSWNNGATTQSITGLTAGNYTVNVTDSTGCEIFTGITVNVVPQVGLAGVISSQPNCLSNDGQLEIIISGGTPPYNFSGSNGTSVTTIGQSYTFSGLSAGLFSVKVTDAGLCSFTHSENLLNSNGFNVLSITTQNSTCSFNDGEITVVINGGAGTYTYSISDGITTTSNTTNSLSYIFTGLESKTYQVSISGGTCFYTQSITVNNTPTLNIDFNYTATTCNNCDGVIELIASGLSAPYNYQITGPTTQLINGYPYSSYTFTNLCSGNYVGSITNNFCTVSDNIIIPASQNVFFSLVPTSPTGPSFNDGIISAFITTGIPPFTYTWSSNVNGQTGLTVTNLTAGTYSLTVIDANDCVYSNSVKLTGYVNFTNYRTYNICNNVFSNEGVLLKKGQKQMFQEGYYDLTLNDTNCVLISAIYTAIVTVGTQTVSQSYYTGYTYDDVPTDELWSETITNLLASIDGVSNVTTNIDNNTVNIQAPCNTLDGNNVDIDYDIEYNVECEDIAEASPTPTPTPTITPTLTPTMTPTPTPTQPICNICDIGFDVYSSNTVGYIVAGNITGTCTVGDYKISWLDSNGNVTYTSGSGPIFQPYNFTHPLVGNSSLLAIADTYTPRIDSIILNGVTYNNLQNCFEPVTILPFTCENGNSDLPQYEHKIEFTAATIAGNSVPVSASFEISASTKYVPWKFKGFNVPDKLKLTFSGSSYSVPIGLDYWEVGSAIYPNPNLNLNFSNYPFSADTAQSTLSGFVPKVICMTGLTVNDGDRIIIEVEPNTAVTQTNWTFYFSCLEDFDCDACFIDKTPFKISGSTLASSVDGCDDTTITFKLSGCSKTEFESSDFYRYLELGSLYSQDINSINRSITFLSNPIYTPSSFIDVNVRLFWEKNYCENYIDSFANIRVCKTPTDPIDSDSIIYNKTLGNLNITFTRYTDLETYYNNYIAATAYSGSSSPLDVDYYRYYIMYIPNASGNLTCGEGSYKQINIHPSTVVTTGGTGPWTINYTLPTISNNLTWTVCDVNCSGKTNDIVSNINTYSTGSTTMFSFTTNTCSTYTYPIPQYVYLDYVTGQSATTAYVFAQERILRATVETIPFSGISYTQIPDFSSSTCSLSWTTFPTYFPSNPPYLSDYFYFTVFAYKVSLTNPLAEDEYSISASTITNGTPILLPGGNISNFTTWDYDVFIGTGNTSSFTEITPGYII